MSNDSQQPLQIAQPQQAIEHYVATDPSEESKSIVALFADMRGKQLDFLCFNLAFQQILSKAIYRSIWYAD